MIVAITIEQRFDRTPDGRIWAPMFGYCFWQRYLTVFDDVRVVARVRDVSEVPSHFSRADGDRVTFAGVGHYIGPWQYAVRSRQVRSASRRAIGQRDAVILRVDSQIAACVYPLLRSTGRPYGVEVVADPYDVFAPGASKHPLRPFFRWKFTRQLRQQCAGSSAAAYVTARVLQLRYPPAPGAFATSYSSVELPPQAFAKESRIIGGKPGPFRLVIIGALEDMWKGHDVLFKAMQLCLKSGLDLQLEVIGSGRSLPALEALAAKLGIRTRVAFVGQLDRQGVRAHLDEADLFVLPSRGEGLPRAAIEAMARGLPALGTTVGGFPELLPAEDLVPRGDAHSLANKIREVLGSPERMTTMSARNLERAREYREENLRSQQTAFYRFLRERTSAWVNGS